MQSPNRNMKNRVPMLKRIGWLIAILVVVAVWAILSEVTSCDLPDSTAQTRASEIPIYETQSPEDWKEIENRELEEFVARSIAMLQGPGLILPRSGAKIAHVSSTIYRTSLIIRTWLYQGGGKFAQGQLVDFDSEAYANFRYTQDLSGSVISFSFGETTPNTACVYIQTQTSYRYGGGSGEGKVWVVTKFLGQWNVVSQQYWYIFAADPPPRGP